jgi:hypothetical protein
LREQEFDARGEAREPDFVPHDEYPAFLITAIVCVWRTQFLYQVSAKLP